jgi:hypothetical protein
MRVLNELSSTKDMLILTEINKKMAITVNELIRIEQEIKEELIRQGQDENS